MSQLSRQALPLTVTAPSPLYILHTGSPCTYMHIHTQTHIEDSGARVEQPCLLVPSELGDRASLGSVSRVGSRMVWEV